MTEQLSKAELSGESYPKVTGGRSQKWSSEWRSCPELTEPHCCQSSSDHHQQASWPQIRQKCPSRYSPYSTLTNHLMIFFQQEFSLSWGYKNWLLTHENHWLSLEPVCCSNSVWSALPGLLRDWPTVLTALSLLFVLNKLTPFCNTLCLVILSQHIFRLPWHLDL